MMKKGKIHFSYDPVSNAAGPGNRNPSSGSCAGDQSCKYAAESECRGHSGKQVDNRNSYLENVLTSNQELSALQEYVNEEAQNLIDSGQIRIEDIGNNKESYLPLMENICSKTVR